jgi:polyisoprenoid-binding protein YceI
MKKKLILSIAIILISGLFVNAQTKFKADLKNSKITWLGKKITGEHTGTIDLSSGEFTINNDMITKANFQIDMTSLKNTDMTDEEYRTKLEGHLKSDDFFGVDKFPKASFVMDKATKIMKGTTFVNGKITIKGVTQPITIKAVITDTPEGKRIYANITIDRTKFNLKYGSGSFFDNLGDKTIYDDFNVTLNLLMKKQDL